MIIFKKSDRLSEWLRTQADQGVKIGFVPTMGALHEGHLALINTAVKNNDITVCSIFVNPTQFNNPEDFRLYPNTIEKDISMLEPSGCNVLFIPSVEEIYPPGYIKKIYNLGDLENKLEGFYRPGHFQGVCQVVDRLLEIVSPSNLYLGQKDLQQCLVIRKLLEITNRQNSISLNIVPTIRESDGLAMSSRNMRLNDEQRFLARSISRQLYYLKEHLNDQPISKLKSFAALELEQSGFKVDYVAIARQNNLDEATDSSLPLVGLIAATIGNIRLIDNLLLN